MRSILFFFAALLLAGSSASEAAGVSNRTEDRYFGQPAPGPKARPFALEILASRPDNYVRAITFSPAGDEAYWPVIDTTDGYKRRIVYSRLQEGLWTSPVTAPFSSSAFFDDVPFISPSGRKMFFTSARPLEDGGKIDKERIWFMMREGAEWSGPVPLPGPVNTEFAIHQQVSLDNQDNLYIGGEGPGGFGSLDIYLLDCKEGEYLEPANLGEAINSDEADYAPCVSPDGSCLIFTRNIGEGWTLMVSFRDRNGEWTTPADLRESLEGFEEMKISGACITSDSRQLIFFAKKGEEGNVPYWVDASFIEDLRAGAISPSP